MTQRRIVLGASALALLAAGAAAAPRLAASGATPAAPETSLPTRAKRAFPNPVLVDQDGRQVRFYDDLVKGRTVLVNFAYTRCEGRCPLATSRLVEVQRRLGERFGRDVFMVTVSLDAENDTPEAMKRYVEAYRGRPGWTYVGGEAEDLETLRRFLGFTDPDPVVDADRSQHAALVLMGDERSGRWAALPAALPADQLLEALSRTMPRAPGALARAAGPAR